MTDIFHKAPDTRQRRWWRIPVPDQQYKDNYNDIFRRKDKEECAENVGEQKQSTEKKKRRLK